MSKRPTVLMILDGYGLNENIKGNAVAEGKTPVMDQLMKECPFVKGNASGMAVGLPEGQMGNSEVGHLNMGAGRIVYQDLTKITKAIQDGDFFENPALLAACKNVKENDSSLHLFGLVSDGGVHSHIEHIYGLLELAKRQGIEKVYVHCFLDGRDVPPTSGKGFVAQMQAYCKQYGAQIVTVQGRYYAMDRDTNWNRTEKAYAAMVYGEATYIPDPLDAVQGSYNKEVTDEFMTPVVCVKDAEIQPNDTVIFMNFRPDRARQITRTLVDPDFDGFERKKGFFPLQFVCTTCYDASMPNVEVAYPSEALKNVFGEYISKLGLTQLRIAETEKYAHVTFFFNGGQEEVFPGEDRCLIPSPKVATYDLKPEMSAPAITEEAIRRIESGKYDVIILNFANCDMVGHTGVFEAAVEAVETVDTCVARVVNATTDLGGVALITADHGNADQMLDENGQPFTAHTTNPVPFCIVGAAVRLRDGRLADIAPTMLDLMGLNQPEEMDGKTLIIN